jgi:hypothetical protein
MTLQPLEGLGIMLSAQTTCQRRPLGRVSMDSAGTTPLHNTALHWKINFRCEYLQSKQTQDNHKFFFTS